jgi:hypothetical protein
VYEVWFPYSHHPTLGLYFSQLNPAQDRTTCYFAKASTLISSVQRSLGYDAGSLRDWLPTFGITLVACEDEGNTILQNVGNYSLNDTASHTRKSESSATTS